MNASSAPRSSTPSLTALSSAWQTSTSADPNPLYPQAPGSAFPPTTTNATAPATRQLVRTLNVSFALTNVSAEGLLLLAVDTAAANALALRQLSHPACVADVVHTCNLTALQVWLQRLEPPQVIESSPPRWLGWDWG